MLSYRFTGNCCTACNYQAARVLRDFLAARIRNGGVCVWVCVCVCVCVCVQSSSLPRRLFKSLIAAAALDPRLLCDALAALDDVAAGLAAARRQRPPFLLCGGGDRSRRFGARLSSGRVLRSADTVPSAAAAIQRR